MIVTDAEKAQLPNKQQTNNKHTTNRTQTTQNPTNKLTNKIHL